MSDILNDTAFEQSPKTARGRGIGLLCDLFSLTLKMAWLNLRRRYRRTLLVIIMIAGSMTAMLSIEGLYDGMVKYMLEGTIRSDSGEISVYAPKYRLYQSLEYTIEDVRPLRSLIDEDPMIKSSTVRIAQTGLVSTARKSTMAKLIGIDLESEEAFGKIKQFVKEGSINWGRRQNGCAIGKNVANDLDAEVGHRIIFSSQDAKGDITSVSLRITAIVQTSNLAIDKQAIFVARERSLDFSGLGEHSATQVAMRLMEGADINATARKLQKAFPKLEVRSWQQLYPVMQQMQQMMVIFNSIVFAIVMLVVLIGIFGVMLVSIMERTREFGILIALGTPQWQLRMQVIAEAMILGILGFLLGSVFSYGALWYLMHYGLDMSRYAAGLESFGYSTVMYACIKASYFTSTLYAIVAAAMVSVVWPLYRVKKLNPIEVIQE